jgi:hypothetical protein
MNYFIGYLSRNKDGVGIVIFTAKRNTDLSPSIPVQLNLSSAFEGGLGMSVDATGKIYTTWSAADISTCNNGIFYSESNDFGRSFGVQNSVYIAASKNNIVRSPVSTIDSTNKLYVAWWEKETSSENWKIKIASQNNNGFNITNVIETGNIAINSLPNISIATDKINNVYIEFTTPDNIPHILRSSDSCVSFDELADTASWKNINPVAFAIDQFGSIYILMTKNIMYEDTDSTGKVTKTEAVEVYFSKSNE